MPEARDGNAFVLDPARAHADHPVAARGERRVVRDEHQRRAAPRRQIEHQVDDRAAGRLVEIAGRLVGDQQRGAGRERAGQRDALLLAARELRGIVAEAVAEPDRSSSALARANASRAPASSSGTATFSSAVMVGMRWKDWNTMPMRCPRNRAKRVLAQVAEIDAVDLDLAAVRPLEARHDHQQRRFARARGPTMPTASPCRLSDRRRAGYGREPRRGRD